MSETEATSSAQTESSTTEQATDTVSSPTAPGKSTSPDNSTKATKSDPETQVSDAVKDEPDWKAEARKHESRAKANKAALDKAAADKAEAETARAQAESRSQETLDAIAKALGFKKDEAPPDPEALQRVIAEKDSRITEVEADRDRQIESKDETIRAKDVEIAALHAAWKHGANPSLPDSRSFIKSIAGMDPNADGFEKSMADLVKSAMDSNPAYRAVQTATAADAGIGANGGTDKIAAANPGRARLAAVYGAANSK